MTPAVPVVSVVMATFNRSNLLPFSIGSLIRGAFQDWELIVVGDCCTDDTEAVVRAFQDSRIRYIGLPDRVGEQTGPNNAGVAQARGRYIAFLNHDDMWFGDHLARSVSTLEQDGADLVFGQGLSIAAQPPHQLVGALCGCRQPYQPWMYVPASLWVFRAELVRQVGPWRLSREMSVIPSQDWLYRAHRIGARLLADPAVSTLIIASGLRHDAYRERQQAEHILWFRRLGDDALYREILGATFGGHYAQAHLSVRQSVRRLAGTLIRRALLALAIWPPQAGHWLRYWRKGSKLRALRRIRGLEHEKGRR